MSLEAAVETLTKNIAILTEVVNKQNDLSERMIGLKADAIETVKQTAAKPEAAAPKATKPAAEKVEKPADAPAAEKPEEVKQDPIAEAIGAYVATGYDASHEKAADERQARAAKVKEIFKAIADKAGVEVKKHSDIPEKFHGPFLKTLAKRVEEGNLVIGKDADGEEIDLGV